MHVISDVNLECVQCTRWITIRCDWMSILNWSFYRFFIQKIRSQCDKHTHTHKGTEIKSIKIRFECLNAECFLLWFEIGF